jgi:hypothetical protein
LCRVVIRECCRDDDGDFDHVGFHPVSVLRDVLLSDRSHRPLQETRSRTPAARKDRAEARREERSR